MPKSADAFRTIREVADWLGVPTHVLRFWESKFDQVKPVKGPGGRRYYRPDDMRLLGGIRVLLHEQGMTIRGVQKMIKDGGLEEIEGLSPEPSFENVAAPRVRRRPARSVAIDANAGGTGQGGIYDLDALADGVTDADGDDEAPMIHVETPDLEAEVVAFKDALSTPEVNAPKPATRDMFEPEPESQPEPESEPVTEDPADTLDDAESAPVESPPDAAPAPPETIPDAEIVPAPPPRAPAPRPVSELPEVAPNDPSLQPEHVMARSLTRKAHAARKAGRTLNVAERARLGLVTRRLRTLAVRLTQEIQN